MDLGSGNLPSGQADGELLSPENVDLVGRYLSWHALASEFMCAIVARGIPQAPTRDHCRALMHQVRTEHSQAGWLLKRAKELGRDVPERDEALSTLQAQVTVLCDRGWLEFLACGQVALRGYMNPYLRALGAIYQVDEPYERFSQEVVVPEIRAHFRRAIQELREVLMAEPPALRQAAIERAQRAEGEAFEVFQQFLATSYPILRAIGIETETIDADVAEERVRFWERLHESINEQG